MPRKPFKPSLTTLCALSAVGLDVRLTPGGKEVGRRAFTAADLKRVAFSAADRRAAPQSLEWLRRGFASKLPRRREFGGSAGNLEAVRVGPGEIPGSLMAGKKKTQR